MTISAPDTHDDRLDAPTVHRNHGAIIALLTEYLQDASGNAIEIGSGTGQHVIGFARAFPGLTWWPSDPDPVNIKSIDAWRRHSGLENIAEPVAIDAASADWHLGAPGMPPDRDVAVIIATNVLHITPWQVSLGLFSAASRYLTQNGHLFLYGPFARNGTHTAASNEQFDMSLRAENPEWGVRDMVDLETLATGCGLRLTQVADMPRDNFVLVFSRIDQV